MVEEGEGKRETDISPLCLVERTRSTIFKLLADTGRETGSKKEEEAGVDAQPMHEGRHRGRGRDRGRGREAEAGADGQVDTEAEEVTEAGAERKRQR
jgi:hypothetical protein